MDRASFICDVVLVLVIIALIAVGVIETRSNQRQIQQLIKIVERCGAELVVDDNGNYDAIMPLTREEVQAMWDAMIADIERRKKQ